MGEVYRATDPKLGREVAIKVLPDAVAADPDRLARFEREAKALGSRFVLAGAWLRHRSGRTPAHHSRR